MNVWIVEIGEYSDRRTIAMRSRQEDAEALAKVIDGYVEEWAVDEEADDECLRFSRDGLRRLVVILVLDDGAVLRVVDDKSFELSSNTTAQKYFDPGDQRDHLFVCCWARDDEHAVKIAADVRAVWLVYGRYP